MSEMSATLNGSGTLMRSVAVVEGSWLIVVVNCVADLEMVEEGE